MVSGRRLPATASSVHIAAHPHRRASTLRARPLPASTATTEHLISLTACHDRMFILSATQVASMMRMSGLSVFISARFGPTGAKAEADWLRDCTARRVREGGRHGPRPREGLP